MCSKTPKTIQNLNQKIESNRNKFSYYQLVFGITILFILIFLICVLQINIWVLQENNYLLNVKIEALLVEQQSEAKKKRAYFIKIKKKLVDSSA